MNNLFITQKTFLSILLKAIIYVVLIFIIIFCAIFSYSEFLVYKFVVPEPPVSKVNEEKNPALTQTEKNEIVEYINYDDSAINPDEAMRELRSIPTSKSNLSEEEKNNILKGL